jgi:hypothetical protein
MTCSHCSPVPRFICIVRIRKLIRTQANGKPRTLGTTAKFSDYDWEQTRNPTKNSRERTDHTAFLYRHSKRDPCRSRYRSQPDPAGREHRSPVPSTSWWSPGICAPYVMLAAAISGDASAGTFGNRSGLAEAPVPRSRPSKAKTRSRRS